MTRIKTVAVAAALLSVAGVVSADYNPPYHVFGYLAESPDNPPVNYMKVCEPGVSDEAGASYVVLGISFPRTYQAVNGDYSGDLVIPAYIDGLPVRKINEAAFIACNGLKSVKVPSTVREIGARAFQDCYSLTNVTFEPGVATIGDSAFSNCVALTSITFPKTLSRLGYGCFHGCIELKDVHFLGNAPRLTVPVATDKACLGESIFRSYGYYGRFKVHINRDTYGWISPYEKGVPEKWPVDYGYMQAYETVAETGGGQSTVPESGFVAVITEIRGDGAVAVPETWTQQFPDYASKFGNDFPRSLTRSTGKKDAAGGDMLVWQDYVAGTDPTDETDRFTASIEMVNGNPVISYRPVLPAAEAARRKYTVYGSVSLTPAAWVEVPAGSERNYNFFKVTVEMR